MSVRHALVLTAALVLALALVGCGSQSSRSGKATQPQAETRPGSDSVYCCDARAHRRARASAVVYQRIKSMTDCDALQTEFEQADENHQREIDSGNTAMAEVATSYMEAANARMEEIGCFG